RRRAVQSCGHAQLRQPGEGAVLRHLERSDLPRLPGARVHEPAARQVPELLPGVADAGAGRGRGVRVLTVRRARLAKRCSPPVTRGLAVRRAEHDTRAMDRLRALAVLVSLSAAPLAAQD